MKSSRYSPGRFPPEEKEKEEGVDGRKVGWRRRTTAQ
jgi:hypothetical protein